MKRFFLNLLNLVSCLALVMLVILVYCVRQSNIDAQTLPTGGSTSSASGPSSPFYASIKLTTNAMWLGASDKAAEQALSSNVISILQAADYAAINTLLEVRKKADKETQCRTIKTPVDGDVYPIWRAPAALTITNTHYLATNGTSVAGQIQVCNANGGSCVNTQAADVTATSGTNADGTVTSGTVASGSYVDMKVTTVTGEVTTYIACFDYTWN